MLRALFDCFIYSCSGSHIVVRAARVQFVWPVVRNEDNLVQSERHAVLLRSGQGEADRNGGQSGHSGKISEPAYLVVNQNWVISWKAAEVCLRRALDKPAVITLVLKTGLCAANFWPYKSSASSVRIGDFPCDGNRNSKRWLDSRICLHGS